MIKRFPLAAPAIFSVAVLAGSSPPEKTIRQWEVFELEMASSREMPRAYVDGLPEGGEPLLRVTFTGKDGQAKGLRYSIAAFWDGGRTWRVRFAPPAAGVWSYQSHSADPGLNGASGGLSCSGWTEAEKQENPVRRGFIRVARNGSRAGRYFEYADGTPFLWIGDTWWMWTKRGIPFPRFRKLVDDRASKGFTVGQFYLDGNGAMLDRARDLPDLEQLRVVDQRIAYANSKGVTLWIHPWWGNKDLHKDIGAEKLRRFWRYVVHRFGAYNVFWVLAGEYNMHNYGGLGLPFWKDLGAMIRREDPYERIIGAHPTPPGWGGGAEGPQWSTGEVLHHEPWLDYNQIQVGHAKWRNEMIPQAVAADYARRPVKPVVVTEPWYEFVEGNPGPEEIRFGAWSAILSGGAGHTYGGGHVWWAHVPEAPARVAPWPMDEGFESDTLGYQGAASIGFMARFLKSIPWWTLGPHPELVSDYPARFCAAVPGKRYVVYVRWGGTLKVDLRPSAEGDQFQYTWFDLAGNKEVRGGSVPGGGVREFRGPEDFPRFPKFKDWLLYITKE